MARRVGIAPTFAVFWRPVHCLSATAVFGKFCVLPSRGTETATPPHTLPRVRPLFAVLCALGWQIALREEESICQKERTPLPRAGWTCVSPSLASHPQVFHGGCFGVYGTPPREAVWFCEIGTKIPLVPRLGIRTLRIGWLSWLTFGWRVQTCVQVHARYLKTAPPGVCLAAWPRCRLQSMPGFFRAVRGWRWSGRGWVHEVGMNGVGVR
jgi:hypothetical protein